jgi:hypothetical protein
VGAGLTQLDAIHEERTLWLGQPTLQHPIHRAQHELWQWLGAREGQRLGQQEGGVVAAAGLMEGGGRGLESPRRPREHTEWLGWGQRMV